METADRTITARVAARCRMLALVDVLNAAACVRMDESGTTIWAKKERERKAKQIAERREQRKTESHTERKNQGK
jgi:hypothetical protein